jgi:hypothetical protein
MSLELEKKKQNGQLNRSKSLLPTSELDSDPKEFNVTPRRKDRD